MKVILLQDVAKIGKRHSVTNVPDGYAINQLIPKKLALPATPENLKRTLHHQASVVAGKEAGTARFETAAAALIGVKVVVQADSNEQGHLFQAVHEAVIVNGAVAAGFDIDESMIKIKTPIKSLGEHEVFLIGNGKEQTFIVEVVKK